jgi:hypothetical protein
MVNQSPLGTVLPFVSTPIHLEENDRSKFQNDRNDMCVHSQVQERTNTKFFKYTSIFPFPSLFNGWLRSVPPMDPTKTICFTPMLLAARIVKDKNRQ